LGPAEYEDTEPPANVMMRLKGYTHLKEWISLMDDEKNGRILNSSVGYNNVSDIEGKHYLQWNKGTSYALTGDANMTLFNASTTGISIMVKPENINSA